MTSYTAGSFIDGLVNIREHRYVLKTASVASTAQLDFHLEEHRIRNNWKEFAAIGKNSQQLAGIRNNWQEFATIGKNLNNKAKLVSYVI